MNKTEMISKATRSFHRVGFKLKKHSPEILAAVGVVGTVTGAVMACKASTKIGSILEDTKGQIDIIHEGMKNGNVNNVEYTEEDGKKDLAIVYTQTGLKVAKLYAPAVLIGATGIACMLGSTNILRKRNVALAAAYTTLDKGFREYRGRVIERFGEELDRELKYNLKTIKIEEKETDENGKEKKVKKTVQAIDPNNYSVYARFFDDGCLGWDKDAELNLFTLRQVENHANDLLKSRGHLFLNEVYDMLGIKRTRAGNVVGWIYDEENPIGDNYVDFGIYNLYNEKARDFVNGYERVILLDFNVDGEILNLI